MNIPLPLGTLYVDPRIPMVKYIVILMKKGHIFRLMNGTELNYNGYNLTETPRFITKDRKRTYPVSSMLEYKLMVLKKTMWQGAVHVGYAKKIGRKEGWVRSWKRQLSEMTEVEIFHETINEETFRTNLAR